MSTGVTILGLPYDVYVIVLSFLDPLEIDAVGLTCRSLNAASRDRYVWTETLLRICRSSGVFLPSFTFSNMTVMQLRDAATSPTRMMKLYRKAMTPSETEKRLSSKSRRILRLPDFNMDDNRPDRELTTVSLLPGGRFLVTAGLGGRLEYSIYDVDTLSSNGSNEAVAPLITFKVDSLSEYFAIAATACGTGIRIAVDEAHGSTGRTSLSIFEYFTPTESSPQGKSKVYKNVIPGRETVPNEGYRPLIVGDVVVDLDNAVNCVFLRDFVREVGFAWTFPDHDGQYSPTEEVYLHEGFIILLRRDWVDFYSLPDIDDWLPTKLVKPAPLAPFSYLIFPQSPNAEFYMHRDLSTIWRSPFPWFYESTDLPLLFEIMEWDSQTPEYISLTLKIEPPSMAKTDTSATGSNANPGRIHIVSQYKLVDDDDIENMADFGIWKIWTDVLVKCFRTRNIRLVVYDPSNPLFVSDDSEKGSFVETLRIRDPEGEEHDWAFSFDPFSGRLCCFQDDYSLIVFDYLERH